MGSQFKLLTQTDMVGIIIGFALVIMAFILIIKLDESNDLDRFEYTNNALMTIVVAFGLAISSFIFGTTDHIEERTYKKCLDGQNPYEKVIYYDIRDSVLIAVDSVYILKHIK